MFVRPRSLLAKLAIALVLFTQLAGAGYACTLQTDEHAAPAMEQHEHAAMSSDCDEMDPGNPNLCRQHCQVGTQTIGWGVDIPVPAASTTLWLVMAPVELISTAGPFVLPILLKRTTAPPAAVRFQVFRI